jgi:predicted permease
VSALVQDCRFALRMLLRKPGLSTTIILLLAFGIGGIAAMSGILNKVLLDSLPYPNPTRLYKVEDAPWPPSGDALGWWRQGNAFSDLAIYQTGGLNLSNGGMSVRVSACAASTSFFSVFGVEPALGRRFRADEGLPGKDRVVVISHALWATQFGRDPRVLGKVTSLNGTPYTIIGIMPADFQFPGHSALWVPKVFTMDRPAAYLDLGAYQEEDVPVSLQFGMIGRLRPGIERAQAQAQLQLLAERMPVAFARSGVSFHDIRVRLIPLRDLMAGDSRLSIIALFGAVIMVVLIACANAANLLLARLVTRQAEFAVRLALGATRLRLAVQLVVESTLLSLAGGICGIVLAWWSLPLIRKLGPASFPRFSEVGIDARIIVFSLGVSLLAGVAIGLAIALIGHGTDVGERLKGGGSLAFAAGAGKVRAVMVIAEMALALVLVTGAGLFARTLYRIAHVPLGFNPRHVLTFAVALPRTMYSKVTSIAAFQQRLYPELRALPGVQSVGTVDRLPIGALNSFSVYVDIRGAEDVPAQGMTHFLTVGGSFFKAMGIPLLAGRRLFGATDNEDAPAVAIVNQSFVSRFFGSGSPIGRQILIEGESGTRQVIGVVGDFRDSTLTVAPGPQLFLPSLQPYRGAPATAFTVVVRTELRAGALAPSIAKAVWMVDAQIPAFRVRTMREVLYGASAPPRFRNLLLVVFGAFALMLALAGIYSIVAWTVNSRSRDIAIRMALGAPRRTIFRMVVAEGLFLSLVGIGVGVAGSLALSRFMAGLLYGVKPADPVTYAGAAVLMVSATLLGCYVPARRATRIDPMSELRHE